MSNELAAGIEGGEPREARADDTTNIFGMWMYLMSDLVLFASLFAVYAVFKSNTFGGPSAAQLFNGPFALLETLILLTSSFTCGLSLLAARAGFRRGVLLGLAATLVLGATFLSLELSEFSRLIGLGAGPDRSGFLSSYFTLVGTHGLHIIIGLAWALALGIAIAWRGLTRSNMRKLVLFSMFWHFLDLVWIFIFTIVYLFGIGLL